jgi:hypothetical protein
MLLDSASQNVYRLSIRADYHTQRCQESLNTKSYCEALEKGDFRSELRNQGWLRGYTKEKVAILCIWFVSLVGIRILLGFELSHLWGTTGAVAITFAMFLLILRYTPFSKYSGAVNAALRDWYSKRYVLYGLISSMAILLAILVLAEVGYAYHGDKVVSIWDMSDVGSIGATQSKLTASLNDLLAQGYSRLDALVITVASVDKSLDGYYLKSVSFILAEDIEILVFLILIRRIGLRSIFPSKEATDH